MLSVTLCPLSSKLSANKQKCAAFAGFMPNLRIHLKKIEQKTKKFVRPATAVPARYRNSEPREQSVLFVALSYC
jgi:hypothetical protein